MKTVADITLPCSGIPATVSEAPYLLDGLTMNDAGRIEEQYPDTGGLPTI